MLGCKQGKQTFSTTNLFELNTLPETNIALENRPLEREIPIGNPPFLEANRSDYREGTPVRQNWRV